MKRLLSLLRRSFGPQLTFSACLTSCPDFADYTPICLAGTVKQELLAKAVLDALPRQPHGARELYAEFRHDDFLIVVPLPAA